MLENFRQKETITVSFFKRFVHAAVHLTRNPLGIIALFIVLIYAMASMIVMFSDGLLPGERIVLVCFLAVFPILVLISFSWLVAYHHIALYAPGDFKEDASFLHAALERAASVGIAAGKSNDERIDASSQIADAILSSPRIDEIPQECRKILWVDDHPEYNFAEMDIFKSDGFHITSVRSTEEALDTIKEQRFSIIISDIGRGNDTRAGYTFLETLRKQGNKIPLVFYTSVEQFRKREDVLLGGQGMAIYPDDLYKLVMKVVVDSASMS